MALQFITQGILERNNVDDGYGSPPGAILNLPYDIGFQGGFDDDMVAEVVTARTYGQMVMGRAGTFIGCWGYMDSAPAGYTIIDIEKNGTSIFSTKPQFSQTNYLSTNYVFSTTSFSTGNRITFKVTTLGNVSMPGSGMRIILKCKV